MRIRWMREGYRCLLGGRELMKIEAFVDDLKFVLNEFAKEMLKVGFPTNELCGKVDERIKELAKEHGLELERGSGFRWLINVVSPLYDIDEYDVCMIKCSLVGKVVSIVADFKVVYENNRPKVYELEEIRLSVIDNPFEDEGGFEEEYIEEYDFHDFY